MPHSCESRNTGSGPLMGVDTCPDTDPRNPEAPDPARTHLQSAKESAGSPPEPVSQKPSKRETLPKIRILRDLGIFGFDHIEPVILAALITEEPMLLIGPHGTAKSLLMTRISEVLDLEFRHYNASLINFDDLIGFPVPSPDGQLKYVQTPATIWQAETVIFDEISRCQPEMQNKLFPLVHERKIQGMSLERLRYRWSAMNPPSDGSEDHGYIGSEPLDSALADRFVFVVEVPSWEQLGKVNQRAIIAGKSERVRKQAGDTLRDCIDRGKAQLAAEEKMGKQVTVYVHSLIPLLAEAGLEVSPRRARMFYQAILAVRAAASATADEPDPAKMTLLAVANALPHRAEGVSVPKGKLLVAHRTAWEFASASLDEPMKAILATRDLRRRVQRALATEALTRDEFSTIVADAFAALKPGAREALVVYLFDTNAVGRLNAPVAEQMAEVYAGIAEPGQYSGKFSPDFKRAWKTAGCVLSRPASRRNPFRENTIVRHCFEGKDAKRSLEAWDSTSRFFSKARA